MASNNSNFDDDLFETRLEALKDTQDGIQQMSAWCLQQRSHHKKIVASWLNVLKRVRVEHRLVLFYLANDVIQYSKRKRYEFVESWATALQRATTMVRDEKVKGKILRIFNIWEQRDIYNEEYLSDLSGLLNINTPKKSQPIVETSDDFQNSTLTVNIRECVELSEATDKSLKKIPKVQIDLENIKQQLKDKSHSEDVEKEVERLITYTEAYNKNLHNEIKSRKAVLANLNTAMKFYANQRGEVKVVVSAYKNFGSRIKLVKKKLDEITPNLASPIPSPDINAPSPEQDTDLQLPDEQSSISINLFKNSINGYSSYLDGNLPFDINDFKRDASTVTKTSSQPIEVIGSRSDDESYTSGVEYYKSDSISAYSSDSNIAIPGLNPMPVPPVSEYTSLARSAQQYVGLLPPPNPPLFGNAPGSNSARGGPNLHHNMYYNTDNNYHSANDSNPYDRGNGRGARPAPLMLPPPMPPASITGDGRRNVSSNANDDFNSTWDMNMSWTPLDSSNVSATSYGPSDIDTPVSPPHFERESSSAAIEYTEHHDSSLLATEDVDHRQLHMPPFEVGPKLGLSKEKTRQLDIDHRNLISLTGSPGTGDGDKHAWLSLQDRDFREDRGSDVDYRTGLGQALHTIDTIPIPTTGSSTDSPSDTLKTSSSLMAPPHTSVTKKSNSPKKNNASSLSESQKDDTGSSGGSSARYDPTDMVVDMDMSDEDLDDIFREVSAQDDQLDNSQTSTNASDDASVHLTTSETTDSLTIAVNGSAARPPLLETPPEYASQNIWDPAALQQMNMNTSGGYAGHDMEMQQQDWTQGMSMSWNRGGGGGGIVPPPPRPPFPMQFSYSQGSVGEYGPGRGGNRGGRGNGWASSPQYRNFQRPPRGGSPYFNRGPRGGGGAIGMRGSFRGRFRGNNSWI